MKRLRISCSSVTEFPCLVEAAHLAAKGKRDRSSVMQFFSSFEESVRDVQSALLDARLPVGSYRKFCINDPKPRLIHAAPFPDRVAHHALIKPMELALDQWQPATSFACRRGKGVHAAVAHAQRQSRRYPFYLKMDVQGYFEHVQHHILLNLLHRRLKGRWVFQLLEAILASHESDNDKGLPIGALTSQHFANTYLVPADRWLIDHPLTTAHNRYMDDTVVWMRSREDARIVFKEYSQWLADNLSLSLKSPVIQRSEHGLTYCGIRIKPHGSRPSRRRQYRFKRLLDKWETAFDSCEITGHELQTRFDSVLAMLLPGESTQWRRDVLASRVNHRGIE